VTGGTYTAYVPDDVENYFRHIKKFGRGGKSFSHWVQDKARIEMGDSKPYLQWLIRQKELELKKLQAQLEVVEEEEKRLLEQMRQPGTVLNRLCEGYMHTLRANLERGRSRERAEYEAAEWLRGQTELLSAAGISAERALYLLRAEGVTI